MNHFYASIQGQRGPATRCGSRPSGISSHTRGWSSGVEVRGYVDSDGTDVFAVYTTGGSGGGEPSILIGEVWRDRTTGELQFRPGGRGRLGAGFPPAGDPASRSVRGSLADLIVNGDDRRTEVVSR
jgi:hypothetical protein